VRIPRLERRVPLQSSGLAIRCLVSPLALERFGVELVVSRITHRITRPTAGLVGFEHHGIASLFMGRAPPRGRLVHHYSIRIDRIVVQQHPIEREACAPLLHAL